MDGFRAIYAGTLVDQSTSLCIKSLGGAKEGRIVDAKQRQDVGVAACIAAGFSFIFTLVPAALASSQEPISFVVPVVVFLYAWALLTFRVWSNLLLEYARGLRLDGRPMEGMVVSVATWIVLIAVFGVAAALIVYLLSN